MKLVMFGIDNEKNLIIQFPVFVQPYTQTKLTLCQIEIVPIPILNKNNKAQSYTQLKIDKPYIAVNDETYISLHSQELNTCKRIGYEIFCKELFVVKTKHKYSYTSAIYFNLEADIKENCELNFYYNKTDVTPAVLDGGKQIILANWPSYKRIICAQNNNIPINIPSHPYVLLERDILCGCDIEAKNNFLLESLASCREHENPDLQMYFTANLAFINYLNQLNETIDIPIERNWSHKSQTIPISLENFNINNSLLHAPKTLREFVNQYKERRKLINLQERKTKQPILDGFLHSYFANVVVFAAVVLSAILTFTVVYLLCGQSKLKTLVANIALHHIKSIEAAPHKPEICELGIIKLLSILNLAAVILLLFIKLRRSKLF